MVNLLVAIVGYSISDYPISAYMFYWWLLVVINGY